ncbi:TPA: GNAT family N-acetyltransferase [Streptococcus suis]
MIKDLNLVAEADGQLVGQILYVASEITADGTRLPSLTFGPFSISPDQQGRGYGRALLKHSLALAENSGAVLVAITGFPDYYSRFGFLRGRRSAFAIKRTQKLIISWSNCSDQKFWKAGTGGLQIRRATRWMNWSWKNLIKPFLIRRSWSYLDS